MQFELPDPVNEPPFEEFPEIPAPILRVLWNRNLRDQKAIDRFLYPDYTQDCLDPALFRDMAKAADRIFRAITTKEKIVIHGDYDADGICGAVIIYLVLKKMSANVEVFLPHREKDGYGLNPETIRDLHQSGIKLIITCDCGISNLSEIAQAKKLGLDVIVTDHHQIPDVLPEAVAIIHPRIKGETYPFSELSGGGVAFKLVQYLIHDARSGYSQPEAEVEEKWLLDLVALATVADMVALIGENRALVKFGLMVLRKNKRIGLAALMAAAGIEPKEIYERTISFQIAPRLNSAGRMDHASAAFYLMIENDLVKAEELALALNDTNTRRQRETEIMMQKAVAQNPDLTQAALFFYDREWSLGLTGLVAGRLVKTYNRPCLVLGHDGEKIIGSARSIEGLDIYQAVKAGEKLLLAFGGHSQACGFRLAEKDLKEFEQIVNQQVAAKMIGREVSERVRVDGRLTFADINWQLIDYLALFAPYGQGNEEPRFLCENVIVSRCLAVGRDGKHWKFDLTQGGRTIPAIAFDQVKTPIQNNDTIDVVLTPAVNEWNGNREIQLVIKQISKHGEN